MKPPQSGTRSKTTPSAAIGQLAPHGLIVGRPTPTPGDRGGPPGRPCPGGPAFALARAAGLRAAAAMCDFAATMQRPTGKHIMRSGLSRARGLIGAAASALVLAPTAALAHAGHGAGAGFVHGFLHPLGGLDHVAATVAAGVFAFLLLRRAPRLVPAAFAVTMAAAFALADLPPQAADMAYASGFVAAIALLQACGMALAASTRAAWSALRAAPSAIW
jgi:hydrogenase/urease accessory protein HupE